MPKHGANCTCWACVNAHAITPSGGLPGEKIEGGQGAPGIWERERCAKCEKLALCFLGVCPKCWPKETSKGGQEVVFRSTEQLNETYCPKAANQEREQRRQRLLRERLEKIPRKWEGR